MSSQEIEIGAKECIENWIPFFQSLLWPLVVIFLTFLFRRPFLVLFEAIRTRIERGDPFEVGGSGIKLGSARVPKRVVAKGKASALLSTHILESLVAKDDVSESARVVIETSADNFDDSPEYYLVHSARRDSRLDIRDLEYYRLKIWLDADDEEMLDKVASVTYYLHPSFQDPVRIETNRKSRFLLSTRAWGEFNLHAEIKFKNNDEPVKKLTRYLNLV